MTDTTSIASQSPQGRDLFLAALDALPSHIAIIDRAGDIVAVNAAWRGFGAANDLELRNDGIGANYFAACQGAMADGDEHTLNIVAGLRDVLAGRSSSYVYDYPCHAPYERRWFAFRVARLQVSGEPRFLISHDNVTAQHLAEEVARASEARYRAIFSNVGDAILLADDHGRFLDANPASEELLGYSRTELLARSVTDLGARDDFWQTAERGRSPSTGAWRDELELVRKDHLAIPVEAMVTTAEMPQGRVWLAALRDMTHHHQAEAQLRDEREALTLINQVGRMLSAELNLDALMQAVTDAATGLTGAAMGAFFHNAFDEQGGFYTLFTLAGASREDFAGVPLPRNTALFRETFTGTGVVRSADVRTDPRYGKSPPYFGIPAAHLPVVSYLAVPVIGRHGDVMGGLFFASPEPGVFAERAEMIATGLAAQAAIAIENANLFRQVQQELAAREQAEAAKVLLVDAMAHDLGGPLTVIRGQGQLLQRRLQRGDITEERLGTGLAAIDRAVERARLLIEDLTDVARLESDRPLDLNTSAVDLVALTQAAVDSFEGASTTASLLMELTGDPVVGWWDGNRIIRVLDNLLANAIKYSPDGGIVTTRVARAEDGGKAWGVVTITDQGVGIPADDLPHIFERFHRGRNVQGRIAGTGLGLWGSRRIVIQHGGEIAIASVEGQGTTVTVRLPLGSE